MFGEGVFGIKLKRGHNLYPSFIFRIMPFFIDGNTIVISIFEFVVGFVGVRLN